MSFEQLPDEIVSNTLQCLALVEQVRIGRVNKKFQRLGNAVIAETKSMDFSNSQFDDHRPTPESLSRILESCHGNLEKILFSFFSSDDLRPPLLSKLAELDIATVAATDDTMKALFANSPNLQVFRWSNFFWPHVRFPDVKCEKLETIGAHQCHESDIRSIAANCPNLKHFTFEASLGISKEPWENFFARCPRLETVGLKDFEHNNIGDFDINASPSARFWLPSSVRVLGMHIRSDHVLVQISKKFPLLEEMNVCVGGDLTSTGVAALGTLKKLRQSKIERSSSVDTDHGVGYLIGCENLEVLDLHCELSTATFRRSFVAVTA